MRLLTTILFTFIVFYPSDYLPAQSRIVLFSVSGKVVDEEGRGIPATITVHELNRAVQANENGEYVIHRLRPGSYHLHINHLGYSADARTIIIEDKDISHNFRLKEATILLQSLTVEANPFKNGPLEQSQTIEVIDRSFLERNNSGTFANALEKIPGISTINTGVGISKPMIRGMGFNRILINDRGIKQEGQQWGADHGLEIDPFDVDRVEVIKGPASLVYGADGMAGVINIRPGAFMPAGTISGHSISTYRSNNNMYSQSLMLEGNEDDVVFKARFTSQDYADYRVPASSFVYATAVRPIFDNRLKNTAGMERHFSVMGGVKKDWGNSTVTLSRFYQRAGIFPGAVGVPNAYNLRHNGDHRNIEFPLQNNTHWKLISNTVVNLNKNWLEVDLGYQYNQRREESLPHTHGVGPTPEGNLALGLDLQTLTANIRYNQVIDERNQTLMGIQLQQMQNAKSGFEYLVPNFSSFNGAAFLFHEFKWSERFILNSGIRFDASTHNIEEHLQPIYNRLQATGEFEQRTPALQREFYNVSGSGGFSWIASDHFNLKFNLGTAYRMPTAIELGVSGVHHGNFRFEAGNPELRAERSYQTDVNLTYNRKRLYVSLSPFFSYYQDYIYLAPTGIFRLPIGTTQWEYRQHNALFGGGELKAELAITKKLSIGGGLEYIRNHNLDTGLPLPLTPPLSILIKTEYRVGQLMPLVKDLYVYAEARITDRQGRVDRNELRTEGFTIFEAGLGWQWHVKNLPLHFQLSGQNLGNAIYFNHLSRYRLLNLPEQGRNINLSLKVPFSLKNP